MTSHAVKFGLALGGGAARGWAHVGVIRALEQAGLVPDLVSGTSIGALVGAAWASQEFDRFEAWLYRLGVMDVVALLDPGFDGGLIKGERLMSFFARSFQDRAIETLGKPYAAVATDLHTGAEVWLREGSVLQSVRASIALPGLFSPALVDGRVLVDGGLVNPVPVSLARAMGADVVLAVDLNSDLVGRHLRPHPPTASAAGAGATSPSSSDETDESVGQTWLGDLPQRLSSKLTEILRPSNRPMPSVVDVVASSINIMQVRITRSRMAGDPPDVLVAPKLAHLGLMEFHRAAEAIEAGYQAMQAALPHLRYCLQRD